MSNELDRTDSPVRSTRVTARVVLATENLISALFLEKFFLAGADWLRRQNHDRHKWDVSLINRQSEFFFLAGVGRLTDWPPHLTITPSHHHIELPYKKAVLHSTLAVIATRSDVFIRSGFTGW